MVFVSIAGDAQCHADAAYTRGAADAYAEITSIFLPNAKEEQAGGEQDHFCSAFARQLFEDSASRPKETDKYQE